MEIHVCNTKIYIFKYQNNKQMKYNNSQEQLKVNIAIIDRQTHQTLEITNNTVRKTIKWASK